MDKPKALIIDNGTRYVANLIGFMKGCGYQPTVRPLSEGLDVPPDVELVVLSGAGQHSVVDNPDIYRHYDAFFKNVQVPVFGICLGLQLMAHYFGGKLKKGYHVRKRVESVTYEGDEIQVFANHQWYVEELPKGFSGWQRPAEETREPAMWEIMEHDELPLSAVQFHPEVNDPKNEGWYIGYRMVKKLRESYAHSVPVSYAHSVPVPEEALK